MYNRITPYYPRRVTIVTCCSDNSLVELGSCQPHGLGFPTKDIPARSGHAQKRRQVGGVMEAQKNFCPELVTVGAGRRLTRNISNRDIRNYSSFRAEKQPSFFSDLGSCPPAISLQAREA
ncbi:hypothetical protein V496_05987 [Pseudogymnoascus sp. VKM F-4515 (FW-2607)]|nr:hypothetical protein V496_05987 [Pseudogymnoascus sp. VKM F-4515 (FW-2607)]